MAFHFSLEAVLHLRSSLEHQQELKLRAANQNVARVRHTIEQLDGRRRELVGLQHKRLTDGTTAAEMRFELQCEAQLLRHRREAEQHLAKLEEARNQQREVFYRARQARETLEAVRDRQLSLYQKDALRREQRNLDDLFLMRLLVQRGHLRLG
jgi:flagellar export protein FliJ